MAALTQGNGMRVWDLLMAGRCGEDRRGVGFFFFLLDLRDRLLFPSFSHDFQQSSGEKIDDSLNTQSVLFLVILYEEWYQQRLSAPFYTQTTYMYITYVTVVLFMTSGKR